MDLAKVFVEMRRVLSPDGVAVFVVGREFDVRGVPFHNSRLLALIADGVALASGRSGGRNGSSRTASGISSTRTYSRSRLAPKDRPTRGSSGVCTPCLLKGSVTSL